jgi:hypothetical protein
VDAKAGPCSELRRSVVTRHPFERIVVEGIFTEESRLKRACHRSRRVFVLDVNHAHHKAFAPEGRQVKLVCLLNAKDLRSTE